MMKGEAVLPKNATLCQEEREKTKKFDTVVGLIREKH